jgi:hypothetical protein
MWMQVVRMQTDGCNRATRTKTHASHLHAALLVSRIHACAFFFITTMAM